MERFRLLSEDEERLLARLRGEAPGGLEQPGGGIESVSYTHLAGTGRLSTDWAAV